MSAPEPSAYAAPSLLLVIDPTARRTDGESVRIARDVLAAGAEVKICLPETTEEYANAVRRAGRRRVVVVGDEAALARAVGVLYRGRKLGGDGGDRRGEGGAGAGGAGSAGTDTGSAGPAGTDTRSAGPAGTGTGSAGPAGTGTGSAGPAGTDTGSAGPAGAGLRGGGGSWAGDSRGGGTPAGGSAAGGSWGGGSGAGSPAAGDTQTRADLDDGSRGQAPGPRAEGSRAGDTRRGRSGAGSPAAEDTQTQANLDDGSRGQAPGPRAEGSRAGDSRGGRSAAGGPAAGDTQTQADLDDGSRRQAPGAQSTRAGDSRGRGSVTGSPAAEDTQTRPDPGNGSQGQTPGPRAEGTQAGDSRRAGSGAGSPAAGDTQTQADPGNGPQGQTPGPGAEGTQTGDSRGGRSAGGSWEPGDRVGALRARGLRGGGSQGRAGGRRSGEQVVGWVPVSAGEGAGAALARVLGVPADPVAAARAVLEGRPVARDLLVDDSDGVVLGALVLPAPEARGRGGALRRLGVRATGGAGTDAGPRTETGGTTPGEATEPERRKGGRGWWRLIRGLRATPDQAPGGAARAGLRIEADGELLADLATPLHSLTVTPSPARAPLGPVGGAAPAAPRTDTTGYAGLRLVPAARTADPVLAHARTVTVSGPDFHYLVDGSPAGPVRSRTWTVRRGIWSIVVS